MKKLERRVVTELMLTLLLASMLSMALVIPVKAQQAADLPTVALWHFNEFYTPDATDNSVGILGGSPTPALVEGKFGKALSFDGNNFVYVPISPALDIPTKITIEAWIYVKAFKNVTYNNIAVKCTRAGLEWQTVTRLCGLAVRGDLPENGVAVPQGTLSGFVYTETEHFNEIVTTEPVIPLNQWVHAAFTRGPTTGMHLYVNGVEKETKAIYGVQNPTGPITRGTELYVGHDAEVIIDELRISDTALEPSQFLYNSVALESLISASAIDIGPNLLLAVAIAAVVFAIAWVLRRVIQTWGTYSKSKSL